MEISEMSEIRNFDFKTPGVNGADLTPIAPLQTTELSDAHPPQQTADKLLTGEGTGQARNCLGGW